MILELVPSYEIDHPSDFVAHIDGEALTSCLLCR